MKNTKINLGAVEKVANALCHLRENVVFVGGAVVSLYANDPAADDVRPTKDVDIVLEIFSLTNLENLRENLGSKNFIQTAEDNVICRFRYEDVQVDVMSTHAVGWAPANPWFASGFERSEKVLIGNKEIQILPFPYFLATKFSAFESRGDHDPRTSPDLEDITYLLDNRTDWVKNLQKSPSDVLGFLKNEFTKILNRKILQEAILGNLYFETQTERFEMMMMKMKIIVKP